jgi:hypothetical protein
MPDVENIDPVFPRLIKNPERIVDHRGNANVRPPFDARGSIG